MKMKTLELLRNSQHRFSRSRRWLFIAVITLCLIPSYTRADGIGDILSLFHTITSTLQGPIGGALSEMRKISAAVNNFRQQIIWPLAVINQTRSFVSATRAHYTGLMSQIEGLKNNSATLALPMQLESMFRGAQSGSIGQISSLYTQVYQPVALAGIAQRQGGGQFTHRPCWRRDRNAGWTWPCVVTDGDPGPVQPCQRMSSDESAMLGPETPRSLSRPHQRMPGATAPTHA